MKKFTIQAILLITVIAVAIYLFKQSTDVFNLPFLPQKSVSGQLEVGPAKLKVEIADTREKRSKGLGGRQSLATDEGMLFVFPKADKYPFWMKGLSFPLDFVWINGVKVVDLLQNVQPPAAGTQDVSLSIYESKEVVDKVLEVKAGTIARLNIKVGDIIKLTQ